MRNKEQVKGGSLPELLVVLAVTVVMAAILLPAVIGPGTNPSNAESAAKSSSILDRSIRGMAAPDRQQDRFIPGAEMTPESGDLESDPAGENTPETAIQHIGIKKIKTTDINYVIP